MTITRRHIFLPSGELKLEGTLSYPEGTALCPGAVICHPHPAYAGDMNNNVVLGVMGVLELAGFAVLRFNFRGVNLSEGTYDEGRGETSDVISAIEYLRKQGMVDKSRMFLAGYSFGAWVALKSTVQTDGIKAIAAISPPLRVLDFDFLPRLSIPTLLVLGDQDIFCKVKDLEDALEKISSPKEKVIMANNDHFYWGREEELAGKIKEFFSGYL
jgi:uncharacterized protein